MNDLAVRVMQSTNEKAKELNHEFVGGEHILWAIIELDGPGAKLLAALGARPEHICASLSEVMHSAGAPARQGPFQVPRAKNIIQYADEEARGRHDKTSDVDLLVGLLRERENCGAKLLADLGITLEQVREMRNKTPVTIFVPPGVRADSIQQYIDAVPRITGRLDLLEALQLSFQALITVKSLDGVTRLLHSHSS